MTKIESLGPGAYDPAITPYLEKPKWSLRGRTKSQTSKKNTPGPGAYRVNARSQGKIEFVVEKILVFKIP